MNITEEAKQAAEKEMYCIDAPYGHFVQQLLDSELSDAQKTIEQLREEVVRLKAEASDVAVTDARLIGNAIHERNQLRSQNEQLQATLNGVAKDAATFRAEERRLLKVNEQLQRELEAVRAEFKEWRENEPDAKRLSAMFTNEWSIECYASDLWEVETDSCRVMGKASNPREAIDKAIAARATETKA